MVTERLTKQIGTEIKIDHVSFSLFNKMNLDGVLIRDKQKDSLLYAGHIKVRITDWFFFKDQIVLKYIGLEDATVKLNRKDSVWNYQFIANFFASPGPKKKSPSKLDLDLKKLDLKNIHFIQDDRWIGEIMEFKLGSVLVDVERMDFSKSIFQINEIALEKPYFKLLEMDGLRPDSLRKKYDPNFKDTAMYFNAGDIAVHVQRIKLKDGQVWIEANEGSPIQLFDPEHIRLSKLNGTINGFHFVKDTMRANIDLAVKDRST